MQGRPGDQADPLTQLLTDLPRPPPTPFWVQRGEPPLVDQTRRRGLVGTPTRRGWPAAQDPTAGWQYGGKLSQMTYSLWASNAAAT